MTSMNKSKKFADLCVVWLRLFSDVNCNHQATHPTLEHFNYNSRGHSTEKLLIISRNFELIYILFTFWKENIIELAPAGNETVKNSWSRHTLHSSKHSSSDHVRRLLLFDKCFRRFSSTSLDDDVYTSLRFVGAQLSIVDLSKGQSFCEASRGREQRTEKRQSNVWHSNWWSKAFNKSISWIAAQAQFVCF